MIRCCCLLSCTALGWTALLLLNEQGDHLGKSAPAQGAQPPDKKNAFIEPQAIVSGGGLLQATLEVKFARNSVKGTPVWLRSYNGGLVGPTLRARPGDVLRIRFKNSLPKGTEPPGEGMAMTVPHGFNISNLHTHGLHVSPKAKADNVFVSVRPGRSFDYTIRIPDDHPAGTFWYHAHHHGSVALQLSSGMAGALIVEGGLDNIKEMRDVKEKLFVFQQLLYRLGDIEKGEIDVDQTYNVLDRPDPKVVNTDTSINGVINPVISLLTGQVERWRFLHAGLANTLSLALIRVDGNQADSIPLAQIAIDGIPLGSIETVDAVELQPGNRADVLIPPLKAGTYQLVNGPVTPARSITAAAQPRTILATVVVAGPDQGMKLPPASAFGPFRRPPLPPLDKTTGVFRTLRFKLAGGTHVTINGKVFDPDHIEITPALGTTEEWTLISEAGNHPFHIHVNPFAEIRTDPQGQEKQIWRDTILLSSSTKTPIIVRMRFDDFTGKTVLHCHNLRHEDRGMMWAIEIVGAKTGKGAQRR